MNNFKHLLVIRLSAMGDVAMTVPVLRAFVNQHPTVKVTVLSKPFLKPLFTDIKNVTFYAADVNNKHKGFWGIYILFKELKLMKIDAVVDLHNVLRSKILRFFFKLLFVKVVYIDKGRKEKKALTRSKNKIFKQLKTTHERYADVLRKLGFQLNISNPKFPKKQKLLQEVISLTGCKEEKWIGIAPFAQYNSKMYPLDLMEQVIANLATKENLRVLLFGGGKKEVLILENIAKQYSNVINIAGKIKLNVELNLISNLDCMVSMDSGNAHFSAMLGVNTLTIWGVTHPFTGFAPYNQPFENAILPNLKKYPNIPCSIYGNKVCNGYEDIMRSILPKTVIKKILESL
ncbi:glycosyltransferase family 9 protein [Lutibacter sp.]